MSDPLAVLRSAIRACLELARACLELARDPGPLLDRGGCPVLDDHGMAFPDLGMRDQAHAVVAKFMEREAKLVAAAPVRLSVDELRQYLRDRGIPGETPRDDGDDGA